MTKHFDSNGYITTSVQYDEGEDTMIVGSHQDVRPVMDDISARNNDGTAGYGPSRDLRHKASIPLALSVAVDDARIKPGDLVLIEAMGGGLTWGSGILRW